MAFPTPGLSSKGNTVVNALFSDLTLPITIAVGDRVQVWVTPDQNFALTWPTGWTLAHVVNNGSILRQESYVRTWTGTETPDQGGTGAVHVTHASNMLSWVARVVAQAGTFDPATVPWSASATGNNGTPDPPSFDPGPWGIEDTVWYASCGWDVGTTALSAYPTSYTAVDTDRGADAQGTGTAVASRNNAVEGENPGPFTLAASRPWVAMVTAHRPSVVASAVNPITQLHPTALPSRRYGSFVRVPDVGLAGTSTLTLTTTGALTTAIRLAGVSTLTLTTTGALDIVTGAALAGTSTLRLTATGTLTTAIRLAGTSTLRLTATGSFPTEALPIAARSEARAVEFYARMGPVRAGTRDYVTPSWIADPSWIASPDEWLTLRRVHQAMILEEPHVTREIQWDDALGYIDVSRGSIRLAGVIPELWEAQGQPYQHWRHDRRVVPTMTRLEYQGLIDRVSLDYDPPAGPSTLVEFTTQSLAVLETLIPQRLTSTTLFGPTCPEPGVPISKVIGNVPHVRLTHVVDDRPVELSVYLVSEGACTVTAVYRNRLGGTQLEQLATTEYSVHTGLYAGLTVVLTAKIQWMSSGGFHTLYADVSGPASERNPAITAALVLGDPTWGGGLPIQVDRVMAEAALIPAGLVLDGVIGGDGQQHSIRDWLRQILSVRGGLVDYDPEAGWSVRFDSVAPTSAAMVLRTGPGVGEQTLLGVGSRVRPALDQSVKALRIRYGYDAHTEAYRYTTSDRAVSTEGRIDVRDHDLLQDATSADLVAYYIAKRLTWAKDRVEGATAVEEARMLEPLDIVHVVCPQLLLTGNDRRVLRVAKGSGEHELVHEYWDTSIYTHAGGTPPPVQAINPGVGTPVSFFGNVDLSASSITNPIRMATVENTANPSLSVPGLDTDLVVMTYTTVSAMSLVLLIGRSHVFQYTGTATGALMAITLKLRVNGAVMTDQGWSQFNVLDTVAQAGAFGQTLSLVGAALLPQGTHTLTLQGVVTKGPWETFIPTLTITEFAR